MPDTTAHTLPVTDTLADLWGADPNFPSEMYCSTPLIRAATCEVAYAARSAAISYALLRAGACPSATNSCREYVSCQQRG